MAWHFLILLFQVLNLSLASQSTTGTFIIDSTPESSKRYEAKWEDLDTRPLPQWYDQAKVGIFIHWGVYAVPSFGSEWFWINWHSNGSRYVNFMKENYPPDFSYQDFAHEFTAEFFSAEKWAELFKKSGAQYVVLTSKHHEGFTLWPSSRSFSWNSVDIGPKRDIIGELSSAVKESGLKFGLYHSLFEWFNPMYLSDRENLFQTTVYRDSKVWPELIEIVEKYEPAVVWSDGDWEASYRYWNSTGYIAWLYNDSPVKDEVVVNDRWGIEALCRHGDIYTCSDRYSPGVLQKHKWENCFTIDKQSFGYRRNAEMIDFLSMKDILYELVTTISCGGNVLINVGPTKDGMIAPIFQERLTDLGKWLEINGEAIYSSSPWLKQNDTYNGKNVWYTCTRHNYNPSDPTAPPTSQSEVKTVYAISLTWPNEEILVLQDVTPYMNEGSIVELLGYDLNLKWDTDNTRTAIHFPSLSKVTGFSAWTLKFTF